MLKLWSNSNSKNYIIGALLTVIGSVLFAGKAVLAKLLYIHFNLDSTVLLTLRMLFSVPFYIVILILQHRKNSIVSITKNQWFQIIVAGLFGYYLASFFDFWGLQFVSASIERLVLFCYPTLVVLLSALFFKKSISNIQVFALIITYLGMAISFMPEITQKQNTNLIFGMVLVFLSAFTYAIYLILNGQLTKILNGGIVTSLSMLISAIMVFIHYGFTSHKSIFYLQAPIYWGTLTMAIFCTVIPSFMVTEGIRRIGSSNASIIGSIGPVATIVLAIIFLNESLSIYQVIGGVLIIYGVLKVSKKN